MSKLDIVAEPGSHAITMTRTFDAPRHLVFKAHTDPDLIPKWWGPARFKTTIESMDAKPGGTWRFIHRDDDGNEYGFHGVYHAVVAPELLIYTFEFEGMPNHVSLETGRFEERGGKTTLAGITVFQSVEDRDGMLESGMEGGAVESMERLAELLKTMQ
jgi:uncharacterized protein YndB with AHSA1/START domain